MRNIGKILLVDDECDIRLVARLALERIGGFNVAVAESGSEALSMLERERPDVILLDVMMPEMDGPATLARMRPFLDANDAIVIFMTAKVQPSEVEGYRRLGAADVIAKPFDPIKLSELVEAGWRSRGRAS